MQLLSLSPGTSVLELSEHPALYVVFNGELTASRGDTGTVLSQNPAGRSVGALEVFTGTWSYWYGPGMDGRPQTQVRATGTVPTTVVRIPEQCYANLLKQHPKIGFLTASKILSVVTMVVRQYDF